MVFTSWAFLIFLPVVLIVNYLLPRQLWRNYFLLAASYFFYGWWNWKFLSLVVITTLLDYFMGILIDRAYTPAESRHNECFADWLAGKFVDNSKLETQALARRCIQASVIMNMVVLGVFKYAGWFASMIEPMAKGLITMFPSLSAFDPVALTSHIILPLGISFYTFQSLSYTIDVYRKQQTVVRFLPLFALYVMYFPQLVAGPIERSTRLIDQLVAPLKPDFAMVRDGIALMTLGFFKKVVMAGVLAPQVSRIFDLHAAHIEIGGDKNPAVAPILLLGSLYMFAAQIYMDFSGYSDIARGCSKWFGIDLMRNFEQPYLATSLGEVWRQWHISMTSWFRDYLYATIKGKRRGEGFTALATFVTFLLVGIWHGASWAFVWWGLYQGTLLVLERLWNRFGKKKVFGNRKSPVLTFAAWFYAFHAAVLSFAFFGRKTVALSATHLMGIFGSFAVPPSEWRAIGYTVMGMGITLLIMGEQRRTGREEFFVAYPRVFRGLVLGAMLLAIIYFSDHAGEPFVYFVF